MQKASEIQVDNPKFTIPKSIGNVQFLLTRQLPKFSVIFHGYVTFFFNFK